MPESVCRFCRLPLSKWAPKGSSDLLPGSSVYLSDPRYHACLLHLSLTISFFVPGSVSGLSFAGVRRSCSGLLSNSDRPLTGVRLLDTIDVTFVQHSNKITLSSREMTESLRSPTARCPPLRQARGTVLNTIMEDTRERKCIHRADGSNRDSPVIPVTPVAPQLKLKTTGLQPRSAGLGRLSSPRSAGSNSSCSDTEWQRQMAGFDDLYDATDEETEISDDCMSLSSTRPTSMTSPTTRNSMNSTPRNRVPALRIPTQSAWPSINGALKSSPVPPTPPPKIPVSPEALSMLPRSVPGLLAPPSLDGGSVSSDQVSNVSAPETPDTQSLPDNDWDGQRIHFEMGLDDNQRPEISDPDADSEAQVEIAIENTDEDCRQVIGSSPQKPTARDDVSDAEPAREQTPSDRGIVLSEDAMAVLKHIPLDGTPDPWSETSERNDEMWQLDAELPRSADDATPASDISGYSFSRLSIPSPGGFFASLGPRARHTWSVFDTNRAPSSATAEGFYNVSWRPNDGEVVAQVIECPERSEDDQLTARNVEDGPPTAVRIPSETEPKPQHQGTSTSPADDGTNEIPRPALSYEYEEGYADDLRKRAHASHDRTDGWLAAQASYLAALSGTNPINTVDQNTKPDADERELSRASLQSDRKKCVRFTSDFPEAASSRPSALANRDSIYWRGFQSVRDRSRRRDSFLHRNARFDAVQSFRLGLASAHATRLMGSYELLRHERLPYKGPFKLAPRNSVMESALAEKALFSKVEKEQLVLSQLQQPIWAVDALRFLNAGHLITNPASRRLCKSACGSKNTHSARKRRVRVLDLGGQASCEWAWYLARDYPEVKIYTTFTKDQAANEGIKGPPNHCRVVVPQLWKLPFPNNRFDVISARSLHALLKTESPIGKNLDEYDLCLQECYRCLKPGGYLEFFLMDAEISHAGSLASAASVEFAFKLRTRGYDPTPTKSFSRRLQRGSFVDIRRAWLFLPMGNEPAKAELFRETPDPRVASQIDECEAVQGPVGSTADIASITGLVGGWIWEQWLLKLQMETGCPREKLLEGIGSVFDEGRKCRAGWTCLSGWAMKPKRRKLVDTPPGKS